MALFGPGHSEIWQQVSVEIGATFTKGSFFKPDRVDKQVGNWTITMDLESDGDSGSYTRIRAPFVNTGPLQFWVRRRTLITKIDTALGMKNILTGYADFDETCVITGNNEQVIVNLFHDERICALLHDLKFHEFKVHKIPALLRPKAIQHPYELSFSALGANKDAEQIKSIFQLFCMMLTRLVEIGAATDEAPDRKL